MPMHWIRVNATMMTQVDVNRVAVTHGYSYSYKKDFTSAQQDKTEEILHSTCLKMTLYR